MTAPTAPRHDTDTGARLYAVLSWDGETHDLQLYPTPSSARYGAAHTATAMCETDYPELSAEMEEHLNPDDILDLFTDVAQHHGWEITIIPTHAPRSRAA